jgi:uncharacterized protein (TIGR02300 family)
MSTKAARGTKRTCQSSTCGARFYDLMRDPIACPMCGTAYVAVAPVGTAAALAAQRHKAPVAPQPDFEMADGQKAEDGAEAVPEEALADIEGGDEPVVVADDETFLEEEEDGGSDVSGIVSGGEEPEEG